MHEFKEFDLLEDPLASFQHWFEQAKNHDPTPEAMSVATVDKSGFPDVRYLLYKGHDQRGFFIFTNALSSKGQQLHENPNTALAFYWKNFGRQVRIRGILRLRDREETLSYWNSRSRESQLVSFTSKQSHPIASKQEFLDALELNRDKFKSSDSIPCPEYWNGMILEPFSYEFFLYGDNRLNDRFLYLKNSSDWDITRLQP